MLMKRRAFCGLVCPMGAFLSAVAWVDPFAVRYDTRACTKCGLCIRLCPAFALSEESIAQGRTHRTCLKCGKCVDACPQSAAHFYIKGTGPRASRAVARTLFLYAAFLGLVSLLGVVGQYSIAAVIRLATTGRMF